MNNNWNQRINNAQADLAAEGLQAAWEIFQAETTQVGQEENIIRDIVSRLVASGRISDKQVNFLRYLLGKIGQRAQRAVQRAADAAQALPVPTGRIRIEGEVLTVKTQDSRFGLQVKMLIRHADGWKAWGTVPAAIDPQRGDIVALTASIAPSQDDPKFGFYSRPTGAEILRRAADAAPAAPAPAAPQAARGDELHPNLGLTEAQAIEK